MQFEDGKIIVPCNWILRELQRKSNLDEPMGNYFEYDDSGIASNTIASEIMQQQLKTPTRLKRPNHRKMKR